MVVTHGDADHFKGLIDIANAQDINDHRELHAQVHHYFHNGLVKGPGTLPDKDRLGAFIDSGKERYITDIWNDSRDAIIKNESFKKWDAALSRLITPGSGKITRLEYGDETKFDFLKAGGINVEVFRAHHRT